MSGVDRLNVPEFERPIVELEMKIEGRRMDLANVADNEEETKSIQGEIDELEKDLKKLMDLALIHL